MFCKSCGAELADTAVMCPKCGVATGVGVSNLASASVSSSPSASEPKSYASTLFFSIFTTCCCCQPLGALAIVMSALAMTNQKSGNIAEAEKFAKNALLVNIGGVILGFIVNIIVAVCCFISEM